MWVCVDVGVGMYAYVCACASVARGARCPTKDGDYPHDGAEDPGVDH